MTSLAPAAAIRPADGSSAAESGAVLFDAVITPHRSLGERGFVLLLAAVALVSCAIQIAFVALGAWMAGAFVLFDAVFLAFAIYACRADMDRSERIAIRGATVVVARQGQRGSAGPEVWPAWGLAIECRDDPDYGCRNLFLLHRSRRDEIARDLSPAERRDFLAAFAAALSVAGFPPRITTVTAPALLVR
ncbi:DUF2244 domain-containing protein [Prosthecodimorpha staleyi]|uniref:DUF2244 domain-containing protein n=1 Tax=Prosthecodimorpha staleyi TaxID=2840188 RepID=A0A947D6X1_9HYPH|nr:DUF2244 domain-containing protein [Prosthecodimorpha staleyi]MBT9289222.1 DUF2244 domain-containing protein [Prosthecodimorpha staleyi]